MYNAKMDVLVLGVKKNWDVSLYFCLKRPQTLKLCCLEMWKCDSAVFSIVLFTKMLDILGHYV